MKLLVQCLLLSAVLLVGQAVAFESQDEDFAASTFGTHQQVNSFLNPELWLGSVLTAAAEEEINSSHRQLVRGRYDQCEVLRVYIRKSDIQKSALVIPNGYSFQVPFYEKGTSSQRGVWYEQLTYANRQQNLGSGLVTLKFNLNTSLAMSIVAGQKQLAILGGTGMVGACPSGYGIVTGDLVDSVQFEFRICDACSSSS